MRICFFGHKQIATRCGGVEIVVSELVTRLVKKGYQVDVYDRRGKNVLDPNSKIQKIKEYNGAKVITVPTINKKGLEALIYSLLTTMKIVLKRYDAVHVHAEGSCVMLPILKLFRKRVIVTIHGLDWQRSKWGGFASRYIKFGEKMAAKYADEIIVLSKDNQKYFKETYNRETNYIPNGVNKPIFREPKIIKEKFGLEKDGYILYLARIVPEKRLDLLIDAFKKVNTEKKLVIAGGASNTNEFLEDIKRRASEDKRIIITGFVCGEELEELYSNCYCYCLPSDVEGMPISLLEAMSYGRNCLISDINENTQICCEYATVFKHGDLEDLDVNLNSMLNGENRFKSDVISDYVMKKYNWDDIVVKTEKLYKGEI